MVALAAAFGALWGAGTRSPALRRWARSTGRHFEGRSARFAEDLEATGFLRGNLHTHSLRSDGTAPIEAMVRWYRDHDYQFLAMTEHNVRVDPSELAAQLKPGFVLLAGEEVTNKWKGLPLHVNAICASRTIGGGDNFDDPAVGLARVTASIRAAGGIPLVNHPNFGWALDAGDIAKGASGAFLLEIWSGHPIVRTGGDAMHPSTEAIWGDVVARGVPAIPAAVDDAHGLGGEPGSGDALPGRGWVEVFGAELTPTSICEALGSGRLYASSGPRLARIQVRGDELLVVPRDARTTVTFLGEWGEELAKSVTADAPATAEGHAVVYRLRGGEITVRARVSDPDGGRAWTPAYRVVAR